MKQSLASQRVQAWGLLELKPMHRTMLRRSVESNSKLGLEWNVASWRDNDQALLELLSQPGVIVVDRDGLMERTLEARGTDAVIEALHHRSRGQIRLLWHWSLRGKQDLFWCTEMSFEGVVSDPQSMMQWLRVCVRLGKTKEGINGLLNGIEFPRIIAPIAETI